MDFGCPFMQVAFNIVGYTWFSCSDFYDVLPFPETFYYKHTLWGGKKLCTLVLIFEGDHMLTPHFADLVHHHFDDIHDAAAFHDTSRCSPALALRWVPVNPMAENWPNIRSRVIYGFRPSFGMDLRCTDRAAADHAWTTRFNPRKIARFCRIWRDEHRQLVRRRRSNWFPKFLPT